MSTVNDSYLVGLIGDGVSASLTPVMHEREAAAHGLHYLYRPIDLAALGLDSRHAPRLLRAGVELGFNAFNITHPVKQSIMAHLDEIDEDARRLGAVNTVLVRDGRTIGHNTDFSGYIAGLRNSLSDPDLTRVVQLGAGGAGSAVAYALLRAGAEHLALCDLDARRCQGRVSELQQLFPHQRVRAVDHAELAAELKAATGFAQCTPVGMSTLPGMPVNIDWIPDGTWVSDVIYLPRETELISAARSRGLPTADGGGMAVGQAADAFRLITGMPADLERMESCFHRLYAAA